MANTEGMTFKFSVFKNEDIEQLTHHEKVTLGHIAESIEHNRQMSGKNPRNTYLVINTDEPYADEVIEIMKRYGHWGDSPELNAWAIGPDRYDVVVASDKESAITWYRQTLKISDDEWKDYEVNDFPMNEQMRFENDCICTLRQFVSDVHEFPIIACWTE
ncbi:hypothetical protein [Paenibacillus elgii]|uniref:hypothetical protein n=1 Tax=Paenibacillus elgii TaxID=189691 RepID=UPI0013D1467E|nr:hypothetical protein [Paenibacillus elgii]